MTALDLVALLVKLISVFAPIAIAAWQGAKAQRMADAQRTTEIQDVQLQAANNRPVGIDAAVGLL